MCQRRTSRGFGRRCADHVTHSHPFKVSCLPRKLFVRVGLSRNPFLSFDVPLAQHSLYHKFIDIMTNHSERLFIQFLFRPLLSDKVLEDRLRSYHQSRVEMTNEEVKGVPEVRLLLTRTQLNTRFLLCASLIVISYDLSLINVAQSEKLFQAQVEACFERAQRAGHAQYLAQGGGPDDGGVRVPELLRDISSHIAGSRPNDKERAKLLERVRRDFSAKSGALDT